MLENDEELLLENRNWSNITLLFRNTSIMVYACNGFSLGYYLLANSQQYVVLYSVACV